MSTLSLHNVFKRYDAHEVIHDVSFTIEQGEFVVFVGPSGCGKSTLLRMIAGLEAITSGELVMDHQTVNEVPPAKRGIAMVFQSYALYPHMSVRGNLAFGLQTLRMKKEEIAIRVEKAAKVLQIEHLLERKPKQLSGGQRQRVAIGRAIVRDPKIFLFDEPLSNLDAALRVQMRIEIAALHKELGTTMVYVTHDQTEAMTLADKIVVLRSGVVEQIGSPLELYNRPINQFVAGFIGSPKMNFLQLEGGDRLTLAGEPISQAVFSACAGMSPPLTLGIRPEHIGIDPSKGIALGQMQVAHIEQLGGNTFVYGQLTDGQALTLSLEGQQALKPDTLLPIFIPSQYCHLFNAEGVRVIA